MKKLYPFLIGLFLSTGAFSQSLQVIDTQFSHRVAIGEEVHTFIKLKNTSDKAIHVMVRREEAQIGSSQKTSFCWNNDCLEPGFEQLTVSHLVNPGEIVETFETTLSAGLDETFSHITYLFYDRDNPLDAITVELEFTVEDQKLRGFMFNSNTISLSDIYPNPVSDIAFINYLIYDEEVDAKIELHNVLGSKVGEYSLNPVEQELKINTHEFKPGVYFYTLYVDNEGKVTKKLVIKK